MATAARTQAKTPGKAGQPRASAWTGSRASPTFSAAATSRPSSASFPPLGGADKDKGAADKNTTEKIVSSLSAVIGTAITLTTKPNTVYRGTITSASSSAITLNDVTQPNSPSAPMMPKLTLNPVDVLTWSPGTQQDSFRTDADISTKKSKANERELLAWQPDHPPADGDTFDLSSHQGKPWDQFAANETMFGVTTSFNEDEYTTKIDRTAADFKEKERKAQLLANDILGSISNNPHIQEERIQNLSSSTATGGEEEKYSSIARGANAYIPPGARKNTPAATPPPNAKPSPTPNQSQAAPMKSDSAVPTVAVSSESKDTDQKTPADPTKAFRVFVDSEKERLKAKKTDLFKKDMSSKVADLVKFSQQFKLNKPIPEDLVPILAKDEKKQRAIKEKSANDAASAEARAIGVSSPTAASNSPGATAKVRIANQSTKISPALKDAMKNMVIPERKPKDGTKPTASSTLPTGAANAKASTPPSASKKLSASGKPLIPMHIPAIPPFKGKASSSGSTPDGKKGDVPNGAANKLNVNASSFKPNPGAKAFTPGGPSPSPKLNSPKPSNKEAITPNPFFGSKPIKKTNAHLKEDFNPFKHNRVVDAANINGMWPYSGKRYMQLFPPLPQSSQQPPQTQHPMPVPIPMPMGGPMMPHHMPPHMVPPPPNGQPSQSGQQPMPNGQQPPQSAPANMPPPYSEEDQAQAQAAQRGYVYANVFPGPMPGVPPVPGQPSAPGQPGPGQPNVQQMPHVYGYYPGMMPPPPPGTTYAMPPFMPHMGYGMPPGMPPGQPMYQPGMPMPPQGYPMPPPQGYGGPPQGVPNANGQQNGASGPRPSMPPTPIPAHAHPYYTQSPQLGHAVPYMMMPPPPQGAPPPTPYEQPNGAPAPQVGMGGHA